MSVCRLCEKVFSTQYNLNKHLRNVHNSKPSAISYDYHAVWTYQCLEENCKTSFQHAKGLREHLIEKHAISLETEEFNFETSLDFKTWKSTVENKTKSNYSVSTCYKGANSYITYYNCNRSGKHPSKINSKRLLKSQGSCKLNRSCPSQIIKKEHSGKKLIVTWHKTHYGHELEIQHLRLPNQVRSCIASKLISGVSASRIVYGVTFEAAFCTIIPGLTSRQREMCRTSPDAMVAVGDGIRLATNECRYQFRHHRWNCTGIENPASFGHVVIVGSREAAFTYAISSAGVAYAVTAACARGNISDCGCDPGPKPREPAPSGWKWGGCSVDINHGVRFARKFMDARELEGDERSLMNLHNNKAGRKAVKMNLIVECKCHGVSGSCTMKTCWKTLPTFRQVGDFLMKKYYRARPVAASPSQPGPRGIDGHKRQKKLHLVLTKGKIPIKKMPKKSELVFLQMSPNYCEKDLAAGSLGTVGRTCNRTSRGTDGCDLMCCGRGYNTHQFTKTFQCRCKFHWCCRVDCDTCSERTEEYTCK